PPRDSYGVPGSAYYSAHHVRNRRGSSPRPRTWRMRMFAQEPPGSSVGPGNSRCSRREDLGIAGVRELVMEKTRMAGGASPQFSTVQRYGIGLVSVALALPAALVLGRESFRDAEVPLFLFAVALSAWYGGPGPAALAVFLASAFFAFFFTEPLY